MKLQTLVDEYEKSADENERERLLQKISTFIFVLEIKRTRIVRKIWGISPLAYYDFPRVGIKNGKIVNLVWDYDELNDLSVEEIDNYNYEEYKEKVRSQRLKNLEKDITEARQIIEAKELETKRVQNA